MKENSLKLNAFFSLIKSFVGIIFPVITFPYASRILLSDGIGKVNFINAIVDYFVLFAGLGIQGHAIRELSKIKNDKQQFTKVSKELLTINLISTTISYLLLGLLFIFSTRLHAYKQLLILCSIKILLTTFGIEWLYKASENFVYITKRTIFFQLLSIAYLFLFVHSPADINHYMIFTLISSVGSNLCNIFYSRKFIQYSLRVKLELKKHLKPIFILFGASVAASVFTLLDSTMIGFIKGDSDVGYYVAATKINRMVITILAAINAVISPRMSYYVENDKQKFKELLLKSSNILQALSIPMLIGMIILAAPLTFIFCGDTYIPSVLPMQIISPIIFFVITSSLLSDQILIPNRKDFQSLITVVFGAIVNLILNFILIPKHGIIGAAIASVISEFLIMILKFYYCSKLVKSLQKYFSLIWQYILASFCMAVVLHIELLYFKSSILLLIIEILSGIITYALSLLLLRNKYFLENSIHIFFKNR